MIRRHRVSPSFGDTGGHNGVHSCYPAYTQMTSYDAVEEISRDCAPIALENINWATLDHRRIVAASLVTGVYIHEQDRQKQKKKADHKSEARIWWEKYDFQHVEDIKDDHFHSHSISGSIFEYKPPNNTCQNPNIPSDHQPPKYVIAFRGTLLKKSTIIKDLYLDSKLFLNFRTRYKTSLPPVQRIIDEVGSGNVWLAGHSLGAAIALQVGKTMAKNGRYIKTYLFNPPYCSSPIEILPIPIPALKTGLRVVQDLLTAGVSVTLNTVITTKHKDTFTMLSPWIPYLFVNNNDPISCEYIGHFEHREMMESWGLGKFQKHIARSSLISLGSSLIRRDDEALHQIPSTFLVKNSEAKEAHSICQWVKPDLDLQATLYNFSSHSEVVKHIDDSVVFAVETLTSSKGKSGT